MNRIFAVFVIAALCSCASKTEPVKVPLNLKEKALEEYSKSFRTDVAWNVNAKKFTYAPYLDFSSTKLSADEQKRTKAYRFTVYMDRNKGKIYVPMKEFTSTFVKPGLDPSADCLKWSFTCDQPKASLSPIWNDILHAYVWLVVEAVDSEGKTVKEMGRRAFLHDKPFQDKPSSPARPYAESAVMAQKYINTINGVTSWRSSSVPNLNYEHNSYANKIIGETVAMEVLYARHVPAAAEDAMTIARNASEFLVSQSRPAGSALAYFTPTYYGDKLKAGDAKNKDATMTMDACYVAQAFLDMYDYTGERKYLDHVLGMADTYARIQMSDGSYYSKIKFSDGTPLTEAKAMLHPLLNFLQRLEKQYGITKYAQTRTKAENWMDTDAMTSFDLRGQFEDVSVENIAPYSNLTNCTAAPYASYLLRKDNCSEKDIENARDLIRLSEDQFVYWDALPKVDGKKAINTPCVFEQYSYPTPVDNSACNVANAYLDLFERTGDELALAKAKALIDNITIMQNASTGQIPTTWDVRSSESGRTFWINCSQADIKILFRMEELLAGMPGNI